MKQAVIDVHGDEREEEVEPVDTFQEVIPDPNFQEILFEEFMEYPVEDTKTKSQ